MTAAPAPRLALYARTSTTGPDGQDVQAQLARLRPLAPGAVEYVDDGVSGHADVRPEFDRLREQIRAGAVDVVVAAKLDRLGRSAKSVLEFFELAEQHGTRVVLVDQAIDTGTPAGRLVRTMLAGVAEFEGDLIRERTQQAMDALKSGARATRSGRPVGRPREVTPELIAQIRALRDGERLRWSQVAVRVHHPASSCRKWYSASRAGMPRAINGVP